MERLEEKGNLLRRLIYKGVRIPCPESIEIGADIDPDRISGKGVSIHSGCRLLGGETLIMPGVELGYEAPVTIHNCQLGRNVRLNGGFFSESCFLNEASVGPGAQVREACLLEEEARGAQTVGLKHTVLFPYVTLGSLINLCDCLMAGGTGKRDHSEVGSSYIHFNYTPNQDKATPSLIGDVPKGVMINQAPIFLGGQGGLVGPLKIAYGTVVAAGTIVRKDVLQENRIVLGHPSPKKRIPFHPGLFTNLKRIIYLNTFYIANLIALRRWYMDVRILFFRKDPMEEALLKGALDKLDKAIDERLNRLGEVANRMPQSVETLRKITSGESAEHTIKKKKEFLQRWPEIQEAFRNGLQNEGAADKRDTFLSLVEKAIQERGKIYLDVISGLHPSDALIGTGWLQGLVSEQCRQVWKMLPSFRLQGE